jgi:hypothetical protein
LKDMRYRETQIIPGKNTFLHRCSVAVNMVLTEAEDPTVCVGCHYASLRACPRRQEAMRRGYLNSELCDRKQELTWRDRPEKICVDTVYDFSLRNCRRTLGVASYEKVTIYVESIYMKNRSKTAFVRRLIEIELHEMLHSVLDKFGFKWWRSEKRVKNATEKLLATLRPYMDDYWNMWYDSIPSPRSLAIGE